MSTTIESPTQSGVTPAIPPGPAWPPAVQTLALWMTPVGFIRWCRRRYGSTFALRVAPWGSTVWLTEPADIGAVFTADPGLVHAGQGNAILEPVLGTRSVLLSDDDEHMRRRRLMLPMFHGEHVQAYRKIMREAAETEIARWQPGVMRLLPRMQALTLAIIVRAVFGAERSTRAEDLYEALRSVLDITAVRMLLWLNPRLGRVRPWRRYRELQARADRLLEAEIAARREDPSVAASGDILSLLVTARYEDGTALDDGDVRDQLMTLLLAGHETTATALAWSFERLMRHPEHMRRAVAAADAGDDEHLANVAKEALRVRPVIDSVIRHLTATATFGGHTLPAGTAVFPSILEAHSSPEWGPRPETFDPDRWAHGSPAPYSWIPFGGGTRRCLGAAFAQIEMQVVLAEVLRRVELRPLMRHGEPRRVRHITIVPAFGALARVRPRTPGPARANLAAAATP
jgi:cytochrome P450